MRLKTVLKILGILIVALVVALVAVVLNLDPNDHKDRLSAMVEDATGRKITFAGPIDLDLGATTRVVVREVSFANAEWGSRPEMATLGLAEVEIRLLPLLTGAVDIERIVVRDADVLIETDAEGRSNLDFETGEEAEDPDEGTGGGTAVGVAQVRIENVKVTVKDAVSDRTMVASLDRAVAVPESPGAPLDVDVDGKLTLDENVASILLVGQVGTSDAILSGSDPVPVNLAGEILGYTVAIDGGVRQPSNPDGVDISIAINGNGLRTIQPFVTTALPKLGPVEISAHVTGKTEAPVVEDIRIAAEKTLITGKAELDTDRGAADYNLKLALNGQDLGLVSPYVGMPLERLGPLTGNVNIVGDLNQVRLEPNAVTADRSKLTGSITANLRSTPPSVQYDVTLTADGQTLDIVEPFVGTALPALGPIKGTIRAVGDTNKARVEITDVAADRSTLTGQLTATNIRKTPSVEYDINLKTDAQSLEILRPYVGGDVADLGTVNGGVQAKGTLDKAKITLDGVQIDNSRVTGQADFDRTDPDDLVATYDVTLVADKQSLKLLEPFVGAPLPDVGPVDLTVSLQGDAKQASFDNLRIAFEDSELTGGGQVDLAGDIPVVNAALVAPKFDLTKFFPDTTPVQKPEQITREEAKRDAENKASDGRVFPTDPLPLDLLDAARADVSLKSGEFISPYGTYKDVDVRVILEDKALNIRPLAANYAGSRISGSLSVDASAGTPLVAASLSAPKVAVGQLLQDFANLDVLQGDGAVNISLSGSGSSVAEIMGTSNGHIRVLMGQGRMRNEGLGYVSGVFSSIGEVLGKKEWVVVDCLANDFQIENGIANSKVGVLNTEVISLAIGGDINLKEERYGLKVTPSPRGLDLSLAVPVNITGPLGDPGFSPDAVGSLVKLGSIFGAIVFPPSALIGLTEMGGNDHPCVKFAEKSGENSGATPSVPLEKGSGGGVLNAPGKVLEGVGKGLKGVLGQ